MNKQAVIFGGAGFLGTYMVSELLSRSYKVRVYDRVIYKKYDSVDYIQGDILDVESVNKAIQGTDIVYNLAAISDIEECVQRPIEAIKYNVLGNAIIMQACLDHKIERYVFSSSVYAYNDIGGVYSSTKKASEAFIKDFAKYYGLNYTILQYGTLYGVGAPKENSIHNYLKSALFDKKISYIGDGSEIREYIHVVDASRLGVDILDEEYKNKTLIITGHSPTNVKDLFRMIQEILSEPIDISYNVSSSEGKRKSHYKITPYCFDQNLPYKLTSNQYVDLGVGLLQLLKHLKENEHNSSNSL